MGTVFSTLFRKDDGEPVRLVIDVGNDLLYTYDPFGIYLVVGDEIVDDSILLSTQVARDLLFEAAIPLDAYQIQEEKCVESIKWLVSPLAMGWMELVPRGTLELFDDDSDSVKRMCALTTVPNVGLRQFVFVDEEIVQRVCVLAGLDPDRWIELRWALKGKKIADGVLVWPLGKEHLPSWVMPLELRLLE